MGIAAAELRRNGIVALLASVDLAVTALATSAGLGAAVLEGRHSPVALLALIELAVTAEAISVLGVEDALLSGGTSVAVGLSTSLSGRSADRASRKRSVVALAGVGRANARSEAGLRSLAGNVTGLDALAVNALLISALVAVVAGLSVVGGGHALADRADLLADELLAGHVSARGRRLGAVLTNVVSDSNAGASLADVGVALVGGLLAGLALLLGISHRVALAAVGRDASRDAAEVIGVRHVEGRALVAVVGVEGLDALALDARLVGADVVVVALGLEVAVDAALGVSAINANLALLALVEDGVAAASTLVGGVGPLTGLGVADRIHADTSGVSTRDVLVIRAVTSAVAVVVCALVVVAVGTRDGAAASLVVLDAVTKLAGELTASVVDAIGSEAAEVRAKEDLVVAASGATIDGRASLAVVGGVTRAVATNATRDEAVGVPLGVLGVVLVR